MHSRRICSVTGAESRTHDFDMEATTTLQKLVVVEVDLDPRYAAVSMDGRVTRVEQDERITRVRGQAVSV